METEDDVNLITYILPMDNPGGNLVCSFTLDEAEFTSDSVRPEVNNFVAFTQKPSTTEPVLVDFKEFFQAPYFAKPSNLIDDGVLDNLDPL